MDWKSFFLGVVSNWVADALGAAITGGAVLAWIKQRHPSWIPAVCWGLGGAVVILIGAGALRVIAIPVPPKPDIVTTENVEDHIKTWLDNFHLTVTNQPAEADVYFKRLVTMPNGNRIIVARAKERGQYILLQTLLSSHENEQLWKKLSSTQLAEVIAEMKIELARSKTIFSATSNSVPFMMLVEKRLPIASDLTESALIQQIDDLDSTIALVQISSFNSFIHYGLVPLTKP